jgi:NADPH-dependent 2,4-dienoyl-CoA reductase/sulfur reductase-like enzyme
MSVDGANRVAEFKNLDTGDLSKVDFDLLHVVPPQTAPKFIRESSLAAENGWLDVNINTLQHNKYPNIYGLGDVCNLPTAKTAAAVFTQAPVVAHNLEVAMGKEGKPAHYNGYSSCPLFTGDKKLMMIEFKYGGGSDETFYSD